jgi:hypothetical protein
MIDASVDMDAALDGIMAWTAGHGMRDPERPCPLENRSRLSKASRHAARHASKLLPESIDTYTIIRKLDMQLS